METSPRPFSNIKMEASPTPVVFKSLTSKGKENVPVLNMEHLTIEFHDTEEGKGYFLLLSNSDPSRPLRLYPSAMAKLEKQLEFAMDEAEKLQNEELPDNESYDCGIINTYGSMTVRLVITTFKGKANIWLRLYAVNEQNENLPTKIAVRFSLKDDVAAMGKFISENKYVIQ